MRACLRACVSPLLSLSLVGRLQSVRSSRRKRHVDAPCLRQRDLATHAHTAVLQIEEGWRERGALGLRQNNMEPSMCGFTLGAQLHLKTTGVFLFFGFCFVYQC